MVRCLFRRLTMFFLGRTLSSVGFVMLVDIFDARFGVMPFSAPRLRLVAELRLQCRFTAFVAFFRALFAECVLGVRLSGHRSPAAPCAAAIRRRCLSGIYGFSHISWRSYDCNAVSRHLWHFLGALFAECVFGVRLWCASFRAQGDAGDLYRSYS